MPYSKNLEKYPADFVLLAHIPNDKLPHIFTFNTPKQANHWRFKVYGFTEALRKAEHPDVKRMDSLLFRVQGPLVIMELRDVVDADINAQIRELSSTPTTISQTPAPNIQTPAPKEDHKSHSDRLLESMGYGQLVTPNKPEEK